VREGEGGDEIEEAVKTNHTQFIPRPSTDMRENPEMVERLRVVFHELFQWIRTEVSSVNSSLRYLDLFLFVLSCVTFFLTNTKSWLSFRIIFPI
jgi:hypothetical protein